jgi:predicted SprT family Zn-dependent metalloprotease
MDITVESVRLMCLAEMNKWGLLTGPNPWRYGTANSRRFLGICYGKRRVIKMSKFFFDKVSPAQIVDTIRHEIAHALDFKRNGSSSHGPKWKAIAVEVGAKPERCCSSPVTMKPFYLVKYEGQVVQALYRVNERVLQKLSTAQLKGRPETLGKLKVYKIEYKDQA